ncbi:unnamed protein product [Brassica rapa subsp. trilocularis]|uniref:(rape) hypothetical protein n=1 Tax=Brassica napus TaxID=3708 RepID=A0A816TKC1_BRANA|nr:unnamed protein product [Brassica napus]
MKKEAFSSSSTLFYSFGDECLFSHLHITKINTNRHDIFIKVADKKR